MRTVIGLGAMLLVTACAHPGARREVNAVVLDEQARQAAAATAEQGQGSQAALRAAAETVGPEGADTPHS
jgi:hypothetical protein